MKSFTFRKLPFVCLALSLSAHACGHGTPLQIDGSNGTLEIGGGLLLAAGYAGLAFDPSEESGLDFPGTTVRTDNPGFHVTGMPQGSILQLEVISRHDLSDLEKPPRWLWYWDAAAAEVRIENNNPDFLLRRKDALGQLIINQLTPPSSTVLNVTDSLIPDSHGHLLRYELDIVPAASHGVYGFFARLKSPGYEPSHPVLFAFTYGVSVDPYFFEGAEAINRAAGVAGDFDLDGDVDGRDFLAWQRRHGDATTDPVDASLNGIVDAADLEIWLQNYGATIDAGQVLSAHQVPEPTQFALLTIVAAGGGQVIRRFAR